MPQWRAIAIMMWAKSWQTPRRCSSACSIGECTSVTPALVLEGIVDPAVQVLERGQRIAARRFQIGDHA